MAGAPAGDLHFFFTGARVCLEPAFLLPFGFFAFCWGLFLSLFTLPFAVVLAAGLLSEGGPSKLNCFGCRVELESVFSTDLGLSWLRFEESGLLDEEAAVVQLVGDGIASSLPAFEYPDRHIRRWFLKGLDTLKPASPALKATVS